MYIYIYNYKCISGLRLKMDSPPKKKHTGSLKLLRADPSTPAQAAVEESQERSDLVLRDVKGDPQ